MPDNYGKDPDAISRLTPEQDRVTAELHGAGRAGSRDPAPGLQALDDQD